MNLKEQAQSILNKAGITINGDQPWDIQVHNDKVYQRVFSSGNLGLGESYMDGWWDCEALDVLFDKIVSARISQRIRPIEFIPAYLKSKVLNLQDKKGALKVAKEHYDIGNDLYEKMLDPYMQYTCSYWKTNDNLASAQEDKLKLICEKLQLKPGMKVLDIGCGWGGFAKYAAKNYNVQVTGITISKEQAEYARKFCKGLPVIIEEQDYRDASGSFDRVLSIGMFEHVGPKNYKTYFEVNRRVLKDDGIAFLHTIGFYKTLKFGERWYTKYIFPNGHLPSLSQITTAMENLFKVEDIQNIGAYYDPTMYAWYKNFEKAWPELKDKYGDRFYRMWRYYLLSTSGLWRARELELYQIVMSKHGVRGGYIAPR